MLKSHLLQNWNSEDCRPLFNKSMSRDRFGKILRFIRFDDRTGRHKNKLAPISELAEKLAANCRNQYNSNANITIGEQLVNAFQNLHPIKAREIWN